MSLSSRGYFDMGCVCFGQMAGLVLLVDPFLEARVIAELRTRDDGKDDIRVVTNL